MYFLLNDNETEKKVVSLKHQTSLLLGLRNVRL